jgi:hypothetical protein
MDEGDENLPLENSWCFWFDKGQKQKIGGVRGLERGGRQGVALLGSFHVFFSSFCFFFFFSFFFCGVLFVLAVLTNEVG